MFIELFKYVKNIIKRIRILLIILLKCFSKVIFFKEGKEENDKNFVKFYIINFGIKSKKCEHLYDLVQQHTNIVLQHSPQQLLYFKWKICKKGWNE